MSKLNASFSSLQRFGSGGYKNLITVGIEKRQKNMAELTTWVSDKLHDVLGFSDKYTAEYLIGLAKTSTNPESLVQRVSEGLNADDKVASFALELWSKLPHKSQPAEHPYRAKERALIEQREKYMGYSLVSDDDDDEEPLIMESKKDRKRKHLRRKTETSSSDEDSPVGDTRSKEIDKDSDSDEWEKEEKERKKDLEERDAFADRLKKRDKEKTRNIMERSDKKVF